MAKKLISFRLESELIQQLREYCATNQVTMNGSIESLVAGLVRAKNYPPTTRDTDEGESQLATIGRDTLRLHQSYKIDDNYEYDLESDVAELESAVTVVNDDYQPLGRNEVLTADGRILRLTV